MHHWTFLCKISVSCFQDILHYPREGVKLNLTIVNMEIKSTMLKICMYSVMMRFYKPILWSESLMNSVPHIVNWVISTKLGLASMGEKHKNVTLEKCIFVVSMQKCPRLSALFVTQRRIYTKPISLFIYFAYIFCAMDRTDSWEYLSQNAFCRCVFVFLAQQYNIWSLDHKRPRCISFLGIDIFRIFKIKTT